MKKTRLTVLAAAALVALGIGLSALAHLAASRVEAQADRLPEAARFMPADSVFVAYVNLARLLESPLRDEWERRQTEQYLEHLDKLRQATGLDPWTDLTSAAVSAAAPEPEPAPKTAEEAAPSTDAGRRAHRRGGQWGMVVKGNFNPEQIARAIEEEAAKHQAERSVTRSSYRSTTLYLLGGGSDGEARRERLALAFPETSTALFGSPERVKAMLDAGAGRARSVAAGPLAPWLQQLPLDETFWVVGSADTGLRKMLGGGEGESGRGLKLPPVKYFSFSARLGQSIDAAARAEATDAESARKLAEVVRGFVALGSLQAGDQPELANLLNAVQIETDESRVAVSLNVPYETLERLATRAQPRGEDSK